MLNLKEIKDCLDSLGMWGKRKHHPYLHILLLDKLTSLKLKDMLLLVNADSLENQSIPFMKFFECSGNDSYFRNFSRGFFRSYPMEIYSDSHLLCMPLRNNGIS